MRYAIEIPDLGSLILTHSWNGAIKGLKEWPVGSAAAGRRRRSSPSGSWSASAVIMLLVVIVGQVLRCAAVCATSVLVPAPVPVVAPLGFIAVIAGWIVDRGRPPAMDRLWPAAHRGFRVAVADRHRRRVLARVLHRRLSDHVSDRHRLHGRAWCAAARNSAELESPLIRSRAAGRTSRSTARARGTARCDGGRTMVLDLVPIWTVLLGLGGLLLRRVRRLRSRRRHPLRLRARTTRRAASLMNSIAPIWDGNETWLVFGGLGLLAAFPARLRHHHSGGLFPDPDHAAGARLPRRRLRIPLQACRRCAASGIAPSAAARRWRPSRKVSCSAPSSRASRSTAGDFAGTSFDWVTPFALAHRRWR